MPVKLTTDAVEQSAYVLTAAFTDENGNAMSPASLSWSLTDTAGNVVNSREDVAVPAPGTEVHVALSGNDLALTGDSDRGFRVVTFSGTYTSAITGGLLPFKESARFRVRNLVAV